MRCTRLVDPVQQRGHALMRARMGRIECQRRVVMPPSHRRLVGAVQQPGQAHVRRRILGMRLHGLTEHGQRDAGVAGRGEQVPEIGQRPSMAEVARQHVEIGLSRRIAEAEPVEQAASVEQQVDLVGRRDQRPLDPFQRLLGGAMGRRCRRPIKGHG